MKLSQNVLWSATGITLPLIVGVLVTPKIVSGLGLEKFGALSVIWMIIGYFSVFDLGLSRTLTKLVADKLGTGDLREVPQLASTALAVVAIAGTILGLAISASSGWIANSLLHASASQAHDTSVAIIWVALSLPAVLVATALFGLLEAFQAFSLISMVRLPIGVLTFVAPLIVLSFSKSLGVITAVLCVIRFATSAILMKVCFRVVPELKTNMFVPHRYLLRPLLTYGGWLTVSNVVGPVMTYFDRFLIASIAGSAAIAFYTVPYDVLTRLWVFPTALQAVLFPAFVTLRHRDAARLRVVFAKSSETTLLLMTPPLLATALLGREGLELWLGPQFADHSAQVAAILMAGVLINASARIPFSFVQSAGCARWTALTHLLELPFYVASLWWLLKEYGIDGAAAAWTGRVCIDTVVFYSLGVKIDPLLLRESAKAVMLVLGACVMAALLGFFISNVWLRVAVVGAVSVICGFVLLLRLKGVLGYGPLWKRS